MAVMTISATSSRAFYNTNYGTANNSAYMGFILTGGNYFKGTIHFVLPSTLAGSTINSCYYRFTPGSHQGTSNRGSVFRFEEANNPADPSAWTVATHDARPQTANSEQKTITYTATTQQSVLMTAELKEVLASFPNTTTLNVRYLGNVGGTTTTNYVPMSSPQLVIDYTPPNTLPTATWHGASYGAGSLIGPNNPNYTLSFTPNDADADPLTWEVRTPSGSGSLLIASGPATRGVVNNVNVAYNSPNLVQGNNSYILWINDGKASVDIVSTQVRVDTTAPTYTSIQTSPSPATSQDYAYVFTLTDNLSTWNDELSVQIRTASGTGGTLLWEGTATHNVQKTTPVINDPTLTHGSNTRWIRVLDGALNVYNTSFNVDAVLVQTYEETGVVQTIGAEQLGTDTLVADTVAPTVGSITHSPNPVRSI